MTRVECASRMIACLLLSILTVACGETVSDELIDESTSPTGQVAQTNDPASLAADGEDGPIEPAVSGEPGGAEAETLPPQNVTLVAVNESNGEPVSGDVEWTLIRSATEDVQVIDDQGSRISTMLHPGDYEVFVRAGSANGEKRLALGGSAGDRFEIPLSTKTTRAPFDAPASAPAGSVLQFAWRGPDNKGDLIFIMSPKTADNRYPLATGNRHVTADGPIARLVAPARPGNYEIRYFSMGNGTVLHRMPLEVTEPQVTIEAPRVAEAGAGISVDFEGLGAPGDILFVGSRDMAHNKYPLMAHYRVSSGSPAKLTAPAKAGSYEIRYYSRANGTVLVRRALIVR